MSTLAVIRELRRGERRVAVVPAEIPKLTAAGLQVVVERAPAKRSGFDDQDYAALDGVRVVERPVGRPRRGRRRGRPCPRRRPDEARALPVESDAAELSCRRRANVDTIAVLRDRQVSAFSFDLVPRTSRAQAMDALSSQASLAGYQAAIVAAERLNRVVPMMMTAAGTVAPARVLVMGAGVAGLQAIATVRRLGASVNAYDVRPEAAEEVQSLGARFVELPLEARPGRRRVRGRAGRRVPGPPAAADLRHRRPLRRGDHHRRRSRAGRLPGW